MNTVELLEIACAIVPERQAIVAGPRGESRATFAALRERAARLASALAAMGVCRGDRVTMMDVNTPAHPETYFACAMLDAIYVPLNYRTRASDLSHMVQRAAPAVVIGGERYTGLIDSCLQADGARTGRLQVGGDGRRPGWDSYADTLAAAPPFDGSPEGSDDDTTMIMFTSGSTSAPKGVQLTHGSFTSFVLANVDPADPDIAERNLLSVPLYHIAGVQSLMSAIYGGRTIVLQPQFEAEEWMALVQQERVNRVLLVPTMLKAVMDHPRFGEFDLSSVDVITYGAAAMPEAVILEAIEKFPGARFINAFGQTETAATITMLPPEDHVLSGTPEEVATRRRRLRSIGVPLPDIEVRIVDDAGADLPRGQAGEIVTRGPRLMKGYWGENAVADAIDPDGWLRTGDLGYQDDDGYIFLTGRAREIIKRGGEMISPEEVEDALERHPAVREAAVIGIPDETWGEVVHGVVALNAGADADAPTLIEHVRGELASFKKPEVIHFVDALPRNALGKVLRPRVKEQFGGR